MTLHDKIGQMLVFGWVAEPVSESYRINEHARALIEEMRAGSLILMNRNVRRPDELRETLIGMQSLAAENGMPPLLVSVDQEGGSAARLRPPHFRASRDAWLVGESGDPYEARRQAASIGHELRDVGINWNFAPVLDVNNNPDNPIIGRRAYGDDPRHVASLGAAATRGYQDDAGIMACGKHFPGHGDTSVDSHQALPIIPHSLDRLREVELVPFQAAVDAGLAAIMTTHIMFPALDAKYPATLSPRILTGLLRDEIGFDGIIITDCLEMRGITDFCSIAEAAVLTVEAGADMVLCCHTLSRQRELQASLLAAVESGRVSEARIDESLARIAKAKERWAAPVTELATVAA